MIQVNELRIGNFLNYINSDGKKVPVKVVSLQESVSNFHNDGISIREGNRIISAINTEYIPLTEEILLKCGFKKDSAGIYHHTDISIYLMDDEYLLYGRFSLKKVCFRYLHQLQNLFFALTGKELEVKLC